jgi:small subunit ribosomal protein S12e
VELDLKMCFFFDRRKDGLLTIVETGTLDREGNARKVVNCSCVVVKDWGEDSQERSILTNYFETEQ